MGLIARRARTGDDDMNASTDRDFPAIGKAMRVQFGETVFRLNFRDPTTMSFVGLAGPFKGVSDTVQYTAVKIRDGVYMVYWHEPGTGANVVHLEDFERGVVFTNIAQPDGSFLNMQGTLVLEQVA